MMMDQYQQPTEDDDDEDDATKADGGDSSSSLMPDGRAHPHHNTKLIDRPNESTHRQADRQAGRQA